MTTFSENLGGYGPFGPPLSTLIQVCPCVGMNATRSVLVSTSKQSWRNQA